MARRQSRRSSLSRRMVRQGGAALVIDYGHVESAPGDTLQAVGGHAFVNPLESPGAGRSDRPCRFPGLCARRRKHGRARARARSPRPNSCATSASRSAPRRSRRWPRPEKAAEIDSAIKRLLGEGRTEMGKLFKAIGIAHPSLGTLPGFDAGAVNQTPCCKRHRSPGSPASATASSPARAACRRASTKASTAASAPRTRPPRSPRTAPAWPTALGVAPERFLTCYQIHSPTVVVAETPWPASDRPRADAIVTRVPGLAIGVSTADCGPVLLADPAGARDRRRARRMARRAHRRHRGDGRRDGQSSAPSATASSPRPDR